MMKNYLLNFTGSVSAVSLILLCVFLLPDFIRGDGSKISSFFETYRGAEPFMIVMLPIVLISGPIWLWQWVVRMVSGSKQKVPYGKI